MDNFTQVHGSSSGVPRLDVLINSPHRLRSATFTVGRSSPGMFDGPKTRFVQYSPQSRRAIVQRILVAGISATCVVSALHPLSPSCLHVQTVGGTLQLFAQAYDIKGIPISPGFTWSCDNTSVADVKKPPSPVLDNGGSFARLISKRSPELGGR
jgi:hypothetical protein